MDGLVCEINAGVSKLHPADRAEFIAQKLFDAGYCLQSLRSEYYSDIGPLKNLSLAWFKAIEREMVAIVDFERSY